MSSLGLGVPGPMIPAVGVLEQDRGGGSTWVVCLGVCGVAGLISGAPEFYRQRSQAAVASVPPGVPADTLKCCILGLHRIQENRTFLAPLLPWLPLAQRRGAETCMGMGAWAPLTRFHNQARL